ncbi:MAG: WG repeat-containing protein [Butyricicoccaceae bacterium]
MRKLISAGLLCALLLCGCHSQQQADGSGEYQFRGKDTPELTLEQDEQEQYGEVYDADVLEASEDYGMLLPYHQTVVQTDGSTVERWALSDREGNLITAACYDSAQLEKQAKKPIYVLTAGEGKSAQTTCAALDGSWVIGPFYGSAEVTEDALITREYTKDGTFSGSGVYDATGEQLLHTENEILFCQDETILCRESKNTFVWLKLDGTPITSFTAKEAEAPENGFILAKGSGGYGIVDENGAWAVPPVYQKLTGRCGVYVVAQDESGKYGILRTDGKVIKEFEYDRIQLCGDSDPLYQLWKEDACTVINAENGKRYALPSGVTTEEIFALRETGHAVKMADRTIVFDDIASFEMEDVSELYEVGEKTVIAHADNGFYLIDMENSGKSDLFPYRYCEPQLTDAHAAGTFTISDPETGRQGIMNESGKLILEPVYSEVNVITDGYYQVRTAQFTGVVDKNGDWIVKLRRTEAD